MSRRLDRSLYELEFDGSSPESWLPFYLPQWSSRESSAARVSFDPLELRIDEDQQPWAPDLDGPLRVSNLQTGVRSGPLGSGSGQHPFRPGLVVREEQTEQRLYTPHFGLIEATVSALAQPNCMVALWLIGFEDAPNRSGELCVFEIFGRDVIPGAAAIVGLGVHPFNDPALEDDFERVALLADVRDPHTYSAEWRPGGVAFYIDDALVYETDQSPDYPMQLMLDVYEFEPGGDYPKRFPVQSVRGYRER
jgi:hypothetical protein